MRTQLWRFASLITLLALLISPLGATGSASAAPNESQPSAPKSNIKVIEASQVGVSQPLGSLAPIKVDANAPSALRQMQERLVMPKTQKNLKSGTSADSSIVQNRAVGPSMPATEANFEGVNNVSGVLPPDTQGDVGFDPSTGTKYYIEWVNLAFQIWDVTNPAAPVSLYGPTAGNTLWTGTGGICEANNDGDPITQFDHLANRWMMSQFALGFPNNFHQCIAISATADPLGAWYLYDFQTSNTLMNDYPHFGVWPDGYYMSVNQFDGVTDAWAGAGVAVFERDAMLQGLIARMIYIDTGTVTLNYGGMLPTDLDGPAPAIGTPNYFMEWDDSAWLGDADDTLRVWEFHVDWLDTANTTFGANTSYDPNLLIATADVDPEFSCDAALSRSCIPQPDTAQGLDAIADRLMYRLVYRDFGAYQTIIGNHTVDAATDQAGIHWFELRGDVDTATAFALHQEGVYAPDTDNRWMGSIAMDDDGNIALGYSVSSDTTYPSIRYAGRLAADSLGALPSAETSIIAGTGSQTHSAARWGDYSMMALDAQDGCTFWYTQEYMATTSSADWQTRVASFRFPSCTSLPTGTLTGTVTDGANPIDGVTIEIPGGYSAITNSLGQYTMPMPVGTYDVTASKYGYLTSTEPGIDITDGGTTTQDFILAVASTGTITGTVADSISDWPLYARIDISGYPGGPIFTDPLTGFYSVTLVDDSYNFTVSALSGGYADTIAPITVTGNANESFALDADLVACSAPGYQYLGFAENFESWPLPGWTIVDNIAGDAGLDWADNDTYFEGNYTGGTGWAATVSSDANESIPYDTELRTPVINLASLSSMILEYKANYQDLTALDALDLDISLDGGATWTNISHWTTDHGVAYDAGETVSVDLTSYATADFMLRWRYYTSDTIPWDWYAEIDDVIFDGTACAPVTDGGLVVGSVYDVNTTLPLANADVMNAALKRAIFVDNSADASQTFPMYIIGGSAGELDLTASAPKYASTIQTPSVVADNVVLENFNLAAGLLSLAPGSLAFETDAVAPTSTQTANINNSGGAGAGFEIYAVAGAAPVTAPTGPFADNTRHLGPKNLNDVDTTALRIHPDHPGAAPLAAGDLLDSFATGLTYPWGIGFNTDANDMWVGDIAAGGGTDIDYRFLPDGTYTGDSIDTSSWVGIFGADMTYNPFTRTLWQVNSGGDNCIYEMDPAANLNTGNKICPLFGTPQRGLAYDPVTNTYFSGSWDDFVLNHFAPDGTLLDSVDVNLEISGLAYNPTTRHLFVMSNTDNALYYDVTVLDASTTAYTVIGGFNIMDGAVNAFGVNDQAGLEIDCAGNLWAVNQGTGQVYKADSGEAGVCNWQAPWLTVTPATGSVDSANFTALDVTVDATGMAIGTYDAFLRVVNSTPYGDEILPITLDVVNSNPVANAQSVSTAEDTAKAITLTATDADGDVLTYSVVAQPLHGDLTGSAPALTYTPDAGYHGPDSFTFKANDGSADSNTAMVSITVTAVNDIPVANAQSVSTAEDTAKAITLTATDADGDTLTYSVVAQPLHGDLTGSAPALTYTPDAGYHGPDSFTFKANDGSADSNTATVSITVTAVNEAPIITSDGGGATASKNVIENTTAVTTVTATDVDLNTLTYSISGGADAALFSINATTGVLTFLAAPDFENPTDIGSNNTYEVIVQVSDGVLTDTQTITVTVTNVNETSYFYLYLPLVNR
jgi:hypothetical protein